jgi:hypothetical protein
MSVDLAILGSSGSLLWTVIFFSRIPMFSKYVPGITTTVSPSSAASIAAWMVGYAAGTTRPCLTVTSLDAWACFPPAVTIVNLTEYCPASENTCSAARPLAVEPPPNRHAYDEMESLPG